MSKPCQESFSCTLLHTGLLQATWNWNGAKITLENPALEHPIDTMVIHPPVHNVSLRPPSSSLSFSSWEPRYIAKARSSMKLRWSTNIHLPLPFIPSFSFFHNNFYFSNTINFTCKILHFRKNYISKRTIPYMEVYSSFRNFVSQSCVYTPIWIAV